MRSLQKELDAKKGTIKLLNLEDELWTEAVPPCRYPGMAPAERVRRLLPWPRRLGQLRASSLELGCTATAGGKLDNLAWLLNLRAMDIQCTPYAMLTAM